MKERIKALKEKLYRTLCPTPYDTIEEQIYRKLQPKMWAKIDRKHHHN